MWKNASFVQSIFLIFAAIITGLSRALDGDPDFYSDDDDTGADAILSLRRRGLFDCSKAVLFVEVRYLAYLHDGDAGPLQTLLASKTEDAVATLCAPGGSLHARMKRERDIVQLNRSRSGENPVGAPPLSLEIVNNPMAKAPNK